MKLCTDCDRKRYTRVRVPVEVAVRDRLTVVVAG
jgi:hypothetical protein